MVNYRFYVDKEGDLCCFRVFNGEKTKISKRDSSKLLKRFDRCSFDSMKVIQKDMIFETEYGKVYFINYKRILRAFGSTLLVETLPKIDRFLQRQKPNKKTVRNFKVVNPKVMAGTFVLSCAVIITGAVKNSSSSIKKEPTSITKVVPIGPLTVQPEIKSTSIDEEGTDITHLDYSDSRNSKTAEYAYDTYYTMVDMCAERWGLSSSLVMAILTQESAGIDRNLMQIQLHSWEDQILKPYNYDENVYQKYVLTNQPEKYQGEDIICISAKDLENPMINISTGCILLMESFKNMKYHIGAGIQCYNLGIGNMTRVLEQTSIETGIEVKDILSNQKNLDFMEYTEIVQCGDSKYLNHVLRYMNNAEDGIDIKYIDENGNIGQKEVTILPKGKQY